MEANSLFVSAQLLCNYRGFTRNTANRALEQSCGHAFYRYPSITFEEATC